MKALVTDGANRVALAVVRALGQAGAEVAVVEQEKYAARTPPCFLSKHVSRSQVLPDLERGDAFVEGLAKAAEGVDVILPVSTNVVLACARHRDRLPARVPLPPLDVIRRANDKSAVLAVARKAGVPIPVSYAPEAEDELDGVLERLKFPAVVKLRDDEGTALEPGERYAVVKTAEELRAAYARLAKIRPFPVIQEQIVGDGYGVGMLAKEGRVLASFCHRRVREFPVTGGPSALCESVRDEKLAAYGAAVLKALGWTGVAMAEFKKGDDYRLLEINPRFWGSMPLATRAGVNFPDLLARMAMGEEVAGPAEYAAGLKLRFIAMDVSAAWSALVDPGRAGYVEGFLRDLIDPSVKDGIFDPSDLKASLAYFMNKLP